MNYKVRVNNRAESKEAQELFFELGYSWYGNKKQVSYLESIDKGEFSHLLAWSVGSFEKVIQMGCGSEDVKEFTLSQLRTMVVLHRNDVNDATHTDQDNWKWFVPNEDEGYVFGAGNAQNIQRWDELSLDHVDLMPIQKPQDKPTEPDSFLKEYLTPDFRLMLASSHQNGWLKVPEGADAAVLWDEGEPFQAIQFHRGRNEFYSPLQNQWMSCTDWQSDEIESSRKVVWQRDPQPEPETTSLEDSDSLLDVVYHYSASFNGARGTVSYDGVITFPGRITGIEDYRKVRAEIAKNGNVTPDQVNVHSLTIVG